MAGGPESIRGAEPQDKDPEWQKVREKLMKVDLPDKIGGWLKWQARRARTDGRAAYISRGGAFYLPRKDVAGHLRVKYTPPKDRGGSLRHRALICIQVHSRPRFLEHDMVGYWLTHAKRVRAEKHSDQTVGAYVTHHEDLGLWWPSGKDTFVVVFSQRVGELPAGVVKSLLRQFPSTLKGEDLEITYDQWAVREIDRRLEDLSSPEADLVALAAKHIHALTGGKLNAGAFLKSDISARAKLIKQFRAWWRGARKDFKHRQKVVTGFSPYWRPRVMKPWKKNQHDLRLEKVSFPKVDRGWILREKYLLPPGDRYKLRKTHFPVATLRARYLPAIGTGGGSISVAIAVYPSSRFLVHDAIGWFFADADRMALEEHHGQLVLFVDGEDTGNWHLLWPSGKGNHTALVGLNMSHNKAVFPKELVQALLKQFPSALGKASVQIDFNKWAVREIDRQIEELSSEDAGVRKHAAWTIGRLAGRYDFVTFVESDQAARRKFIAEFRVWWKQTRKNFIPRTKRFE